MAWAFEKAVKVGMDLRVVVGNGTETTVLIYGFPMKAGQTQAQFKAAVRKEVRAWLDDINAEAGEVDVSSEYATL